MKKFISMALTVVLLICSLFCFSGCFMQKDELDTSMFMMYSSSEFGGPFRDGQFDVISIAETVEFLEQAVKNESPTMPTLEKGLKIKIPFFYTSLTHEIREFAMLVRKTGDVIIARGSFELNSNLQGKTQYMDVDFYHDGTYLGMAIETLGVSGVDKQKEALPLSSLGNYFDDPNFIDKLINLSIDYTASDILETLSVPGLGDLFTIVHVDEFGNETVEPYLEPVRKVTSKKQIFTSLSVPSFHFPEVELSSNGYDIAFDSDYNVVGFIKYCPLVSGSSMPVHKMSYTGEITLPNDFDSWTVR